jgi:hypothetical protein
VTNSVSKDNTGSGIRLLKAGDSSFSGVTVSNNNYGIEIPRDVQNVTFSGMTITANRDRGVAMVASKQSTGITNILFENSVISNNGQESPGSVDGIRIDNYDSTGSISNIKFKNTQFIDTQSSPTQRYGMTVGSSATINSILISSDCVFSGNKSGSLIGGSAVIQGAQF